MKKITMQMIADHLQVSKALVSKALSNDPAVNDGTRETIWKTAEEMGYRFKNARKTGSASLKGNLAVLMPRAYLDDMEYWGKVLHGIEKELSDHSFSMILSSIDLSLPTKEGLPSSIYERKVDGAIVMGHLPESYVQVLKALQFPYVMLDANLTEPSVDHVLANNFLGAFQAATHLLQSGHRKIGFVGDEDTSWSFRERSRGFREALFDYNRRVPNGASYCIIEGIGVSGNGMYVSDDFAANLKQAVSGAEPATGLFCANDLTAFEALKLLSEWGIRCPEDISLIGFDDLTLAERMSPKLTTIRVPKNDIGARAAQLILRRIENPEVTAEHVLLATQLIQRGSVGLVQGKGALS
ncbi:LacI family DNA-binding transcriptional regulator [Gorillibacterium timonense]|uniref:LacI family DNA-binding transcriptional regulator n=1 Tax=Gorillibacterium timonense TaxID=1689269 RepID=UPI00071D45B9|nr:LacI family DNA-binding transcriptional regulator [Gorillibacterium timonense]